MHAKSRIVAEDGQIQCGIYIQYIVLFPAHVKNARWALYGRKFWPNIIPALCTAYVIGLLNCWCGIYPKTLKCALMPSYYKGRILFLMLNKYLLLLFKIQHYSRITNQVEKLCHIIKRTSNESSSAILSKGYSVYFEYFWIQF